MYIYCSRAQSKNISSLCFGWSSLTLSLSLSLTYISFICSFLVRFLVVWWEKKRKKNFFIYTINIIKPLYTIYYNQTWTLRLQYMYFRIGISIYIYCIFSDEWYLQVFTSLLLLLPKQLLMFYFTLSLLVATMFYIEGYCYYYCYNLKTFSFFFSFLINKSPFFSSISISQ